MLRQTQPVALLPRGILNLLMNAFPFFLTPLPSSPALLPPPESRVSGCSGTTCSGPCSITRARLPAGLPSPWDLENTAEPRAIQLGTAKSVLLGSSLLAGAAGEIWVVLCWMFTWGPGSKDACWNTYGVPKAWHVGWGDTPCSHSAV